MKQIVIFIFLIISVIKSDVYTTIKLNFDYENGMSTQLGYIIDNSVKTKIIGHVTHYVDSNYVHPRTGIIYSLSYNTTLISLVGIKYDIKDVDVMHATMNLDLNMKIKDILIALEHEGVKGIDNNTRYFDYAYVALYRVDRKLKIGTQFEGRINIMDRKSVPVERKITGTGLFVECSPYDYVSSSVFLGSDLENNNRFISRYSVLYNF